MITNQNSRRNFLSSMAILSAGAAFGSFTDFISPGKPSTDLKQLWNSFCTQNNGYPLMSSGPDKTVMDTCKGHLPKNGEMVFFPQANLLAQPTWIYWGESKIQPFDVIITCYHNDREKTKAFRMNRFELEALSELGAGFDENSIMKSLKETAIKGSSSNKNFIAKTIIRNGQHAKISARHLTKKISIDSKLIYNV